MDTASLEDRAVEFAKRGDFGTEARSVNEELTKRAPSNQGAWTRLARCCIELGQLDEATSALDTVLQLNPQNTIARNLHIEVSRRRTGATEPRRTAGGTRTASAAPRPRASSGVRAAGVARPGSASRQAARGGTVALGGIGRAEFAALAHLPPQGAADSLTTRLDPLLMALNDRPFAARVVEARNRAGHAGARLFRRGSLQPGGNGHVHVHQQGGRWEPQLTVGVFAAPEWRRDCVSAGIGFDLRVESSGASAHVRRERLFQQFETFQQLISSAWRQYLTEWMRTNGGFVQHGAHPPATDLLPADAIALLARAQPAEAGWVFCGRWLFADRGEDVGIMTDAPRLIRWIEQTFTDLLPLWSSVYRGEKSV